MNPLEVFSHLAELLPVAMALVTPRGDILATNPVFRDKYATAKLFCEELTQDTSKARAFIRDCSGARALIPGNLNLKTKDGTYESTHVQGGLLTTEPTTLVIRVTPRSEAIPQFSALNRKVTELSAEVDRRQALEEQLKDVVARLTEDNKRKDEFLAMLAHELRHSKIVWIGSGRPTVSHRDPSCPDSGGRMNAFVKGLKAQLEADPDRSRRGERILRIINARPSKMRDRRLARMEAHARAAVGAGPNEAVDWSKVDWAGVFEKILEILLKFLPLIL